VVRWWLKVAVGGRKSTNQGLPYCRSSTRYSSHHSSLRGRLWLVARGPGGAEGESGLASSGVVVVGG